MFDYQKVKLVGITKPVLEGISTPEDLVSYCARVSNPSNQNNFNTAPKLLRYCINNKHWSPFEIINIVMEIETTRDIGRQILRHRSFTFQEFSQRYAEVQSPMAIREARSQDLKNRQNSIANVDEETQKIWQLKQNCTYSIAMNDYEWAIQNGIAKECARAVLPEGLTMSRMYMSGSLRSWIHYCDLRTGNGTQLEHIDIAKKAQAILINEFSFLKEYFNNTEH